MHQQTPRMASYFLGAGTSPIRNQATASVLTQNARASGVGGGNGPSIGMTGNSTIDLQDCALTSNSTGSDSIDLAGSSNLTAYTIYTAGGINNPGNLNLTVPATTYGTAPTDPYASTTPGDAEHAGPAVGADNRRPNEKAIAG